VQHREHHVDAAQGAHTVARVDDLDGAERRIRRKDNSGARLFGYSR
jgi:hypothetical protein